MKDDFDNDMGLPDDELTGGSAAGDTGEAGLGGESETDVAAGEPTGRPSGGARARKSSGSWKSSGASRAARSSGGVRKSAKKKAAKPAKKKGGAKKAAPKRAKKSARGKKKGGRRR